MAKKKIIKPKKPKGFQKNNKHSPGKPKGVPAYDAETLALKKVDNSLITRYLNLNSHLSKEQLQKRLDTEHVSSLEGMIVRSLIKAQDSGDIATMNFFFDRLIGKVPQVLKHAVSNPYDEMTDEQLMAEKIKLTEANRKTMTYIETHNERYQQQESLANAEVIELTIKKESDTRN